MSLISLPNQSVTGANLWSQVEDNDQAIVDVVNGAIDDGNIATGADIDGSKLLAASVDTTQLANDAVETAQIADGAVETAQIDDGAVTAAKLAAPTTANPTYSNGASAGTPPLVARKYPSGLVVLEGNVSKALAAKTTTYATLPEGYRHGIAEGLRFSIYLDLNIGAGVANIAPNGNISFTWAGTPSPGPSDFLLSGIAFHAP